MNRFRIYLTVFIFISFFLVAQNPLPAYKVTVSNPPFSAYYFFSPIKISAKGNSLPVNVILDSIGEPIFFKKLPKGLHSESFRLQCNYQMSYNFEGKFYLMDSTFTVVDSVGCKNDLQLDAHDFVVLPNGHYLLLGYETLKMDLSRYNYFNKDHSPGSKEAKVKCDVIQELDVEKKVVFEWHGKDHFQFSDLDPIYMNSPVDVDWMHFNAVEDDGEGNILVSSKFLNEITKIRKKDGQIIWRLGGNKNQFTFINDILMFKGQHDIRITGKNTISLFDNGNNGFPVHPETAKEYIIDENKMTATLIWRHVNNPEAYSSGYGNVQRLDKNRTLVNYGKSDQANVLFNVVTSSGKKLFELTAMDTVANYRAFAYTRFPWKIKRPEIKSYTKNGELYLDAGKGFEIYNWSDGQNGQVIKPSKSGTYIVYADLKQGGTLVSKKFIVKK